MKINKLILLPLMAISLAGCDYHYQSDYRIFNTTPDEEIYLGGVVFSGHAEVDDEHYEKPMINFLFKTERDPNATFGSAFVSKIKCISPKNTICRQYPREYTSGYYSGTQSFIFAFDGDIDPTFKGYIFVLYVSNDYIFTVNY